MGLRHFRGPLDPYAKPMSSGKAAGFARQLGCDSLVCKTMEAAVEAAFEDAAEGETILLAPAAASFDQYDNFEQRGEDFIAQAKRLMSR